MSKEEVNIYFDNNSTTPISDSVINLLHTVSKKYYGNPSSVTSHGRSVKALLIQARRDISDFFNCKPSEITFTSGGTESLHTIIHGICKNRSGVILTTKVEHKAVLEAVLSTEKEIDYLFVNEEGIPQVVEIKQKTQTPIAAIVLSLVNGETGAILPLEEIAKIASANEIPLIIDGVAALGKMPITFYPGVAAMAFSSHKCHGPKGVGLFYLKDKTPFTPLFKGGNQESGKRGGTENTSGIIAMAKAISEISRENYSYLLKLRSYFEEKIKKIFPESEINGEGVKVSNVSNIHFTGADGDHLLIYLDQKGVTTSLGSACSSGALEVSHVLLGMGYSRCRARSSLRFSFSKLNTIDEINRLCIFLEQYKEIQTFKDVLYFKN